jgi:hypothetical protein
MAIATQPDTTTEEPTEPRLDEERFELVPIPFLEKDPADPPRVRVVGSVLLFRTEDGEDLSLLLRVPRRLIPELEDNSPREQLYMVLRARGDDDIVDRIEDLDFVDSADIVRRFWQANGQRDEARLGESVRSSAS